MHEAKTNLSRLVASIESGEIAQVEIARAGTVVARIVPIQGDRPPRRPGGWKGRVHIHDDFDDPLPEFEDAFHGTPSDPGRETTS
jgi:antitoxin (DNA-binding transcriptional repressor) of toxin-antitoxin stability system